jgi:hypothetical protein
MMRSHLEGGSDPEPARARRRDAGASGAAGEEREGKGKRDAVPRRGRARKEGYHSTTLAFTSSHGRWGRPGDGDRDPPLPPLSVQAIYCLECQQKLAQTGWIFCKNPREIASNSKQKMASSFESSRWCDAFLMPRKGKSS